MKIHVLRFPLLIVLFVCCLFVLFGKRETILMVWYSVDRVMSLPYILLSTAMMITSRT